MDFIDKILPRSGWYCAAQLLPSGAFSHRFFESTTELKDHLSLSDSRGHTMYLAQASFKTANNRKGVNALFLRNFFLDIDCGPDKAYLTQNDGARALKNFSDETGIPFPCLINSGNGLYAHWIVNDDVPCDRWKVLAQILKRVCEAYDFKTDPVRTADMASVLRPVGSTNRKNGESKEVRLIYCPDTPEISLEFFAEALSNAAKKKKIDAAKLAPPTKFQGVEDEWTSGIGGPPSSLVQVAERCAQIREVRDRRGDVAEPLWYGFIGLARFTAEGEELIHEWSDGHPDYSWELTDKKIRQHESTGAGPTTCAKFGQDAPEGCIGCPHSGVVKSPIILGRPDPEPIPEDHEEATEYHPYGFLRTQDGIFRIEDGAKKRICGFDIYPAKVAHDASLGYSVVTIRHNGYLDKKYREFEVRSSLMADPKQLIVALMDNHVHVQGEGRKDMVAYLDQYMADLRAKRDPGKLYTQMGWQEKDNSLVFVLGSTVHIKGEQTSAGFARNLPVVAKSFRSQGDIDAWSKVTKVFNLPGMEPLAFAFLAGAFGAPLLRFTGHAGAVVALVGKSGYGKTFTGEFALSAYGDPEKLRLQNDDTKNSLIARLGIYGSLPLYVDEVSNITGEELSDILYRITQGRDKARLHRSGVERECLNHWNTIGLVSSNHPLRDKLASIKFDPTAELNRVLEVQCEKVDRFLEYATAIRRVFVENSGTAGPPYVQYLVDNQAHHQEQIDALTKKINQLTDAQPGERFWTALVAVTIYGGSIAKKLGLVDIDLRRLLDWCVKLIKENRQEKQEMVTDYLDLLGQFIDERAPHGLFVTNNGAKMVSIIKEHRGGLEYRIDIDLMKMYIAQSAIRAFIQAKHGSFTDFKNDLYTAGALLDHNKRKILSANTYIEGAPVPCLVINLKCKKLGKSILSLVRKSMESEEEEVMEI